MRASGLRLPPPCCYGGAASAAASPAPVPRLSVSSRVSSARLPASRSSPSPIYLSSLASSASSVASVLPASALSSRLPFPVAAASAASSHSVGVPRARSLASASSPPPRSSSALPLAPQSSKVDALSEVSERFEEAFEETGLGQDEYGALSDSPAAFVFRVKPGTADKRASLAKQSKIRRAASYFLPAESADAASVPAFSARKKRASRFSLEGLKVDEGPYQKSLWEELKEEEKRSQQNREIREARRTVRILGVTASAALMRDSDLGGDAQNAAASAFLRDDRAEIEDEEVAVEGDGGTRAVPPRRAWQGLDGDAAALLQKEEDWVRRRREKDERRQSYRGVREEEVADAQAARAFLRGKKPRSLGGGALLEGEEPRLMAGRPSGEVDDAYPTVTASRGRSSIEKTQRRREEEEERRLAEAMKEDEKSATAASLGSPAEQMRWLADLEEREGIKGGIQVLQRVRTREEEEEARRSEEEEEEEDARDPFEAPEEVHHGERRRVTRGRRRRGSEKAEASGHEESADAEDVAPGGQDRRRSVETLLGEPTRGYRRAREGGKGESGAVAAREFPSSLSPSSSSTRPSPRECGLRERRRGEEIDAFSPEKLVEEMTKVKREIWTELSPQQLQIQLKIVRAKSVGQVLAAIESASQQAPEPPPPPRSSSGDLPLIDDLPLINDLSSATSSVPVKSGSASSGALPDSLLSSAPALPLSFSASLAPSPLSAPLASTLHHMSMVTACHKLGRLASPAQALSVKKDERFLALCDAAEAALPRISVGGQCLLLWGLVRLEYAPRWLPELLRRCTAGVPHMSVKQLACALFCVSKLAFPVRDGVALQAALLDALKHGPHLAAAVPPAAAPACLPAATALVPREADAHDAEDAEAEGGAQGARGDEEGFSAREACPGTLACICGSLARLRVKDQALFLQLATAVRHAVPAMSGGELALVGWAYGTVGFVDRGLFQDLKRELETRIDGCAAREIVTLAWAFARAGEADQDFFRLTIAPAIRAFIGDLRAKELGLLAWAYGEVGVVDQDFFADLNYAMLPKVKHFTPHDIMLIVPTFAQLGFGSRELLRALQKQTLKVLPAFSPLQLSRTIYGFGLAATLVPDARFFAECADLVQKRLHTFYPQNIVHILVGLSEAEYLSHPAVPLLLDKCAKITPEFFAEDCVQLLYILAKLPPERRGPAALVPLLLQQLQNKVRLFWSLDSPAVCDLLEAVHTLGVADEQLLHMTMRRLGHLIDASSLRDFLRTLGCLASLSSVNRLLLRTHIHRRQKVQKALSNKLAILANACDSGDGRGAEAGRADAQGEKETRKRRRDIQSRIVILHACAKLGFHDENVARILDDVQQAVEVEGQLLSLPAFCYLVWALAETNAKIGWTRSLLRYALHRRYSGASAPPLLQLVQDREAYARMHDLASYAGGELFLSSYSPGEVGGREGERPAESGGKEERNEPGGHEEVLARREEEASRDKEVGQALLKLAFAAVVLGEEEFLIPLLEEAVERLRGALPVEILNAQQVCLHVRDLAAPPPRLSPALAEWIETVLSTPRYDVFFESPQKFRLLDRRLRVRDFNYDKWITDPLIEMRVPHKSTFVVSNIYRVSAAFPLEKHLIDVLTFQDLLCPSNCPSGTAELRQRQLSLLGWTVHSVHLRSLYNALAHHNLRYLVSSIAASFSEEARQWVTFRAGPALEGEREGEKGSVDLCARDGVASKQQRGASGDAAEQNGLTSQPDIFELVDDEACNGSRSGLRDPWGGVKSLSGGQRIVRRSTARPEAIQELRMVDADRELQGQVSTSVSGESGENDALEEAYRRVISKS
ncbi:hypothetical protein BESB_067630 [Besnoitia besnoiti]|uniref:RNA-editing substrate-binding complex 6 protein domain-containing protein n=1 Tax=Besnoitia besnoiti TaxID=94643 RepID=A0A2A9MH32_BESBE|nr:hypothetical protein BESB_067630 [Besnoitia besnoiti]PFH34730.1 hypothetical protein BESB_067630 [Besnoitia besnoiti]